MGNLGPGSARLTPVLPVLDTQGLGKKEEVRRKKVGRERRGVGLRVRRERRQEMREQEREGRRKEGHHLRSLSIAYPSFWE